MRRSRRIARRRDERARRVLALEPAVPVGDLTDELSLRLRDPRAGLGDVPLRHVRSPGGGATEVAPKSRCLRCAELLSCPPAPFASSVTADLGVPGRAP